MPVIGYLDSRAPDAITDYLRAFRQGLKETSHIEGENVAIEFRWAENQVDRLPELAADLARRRVAVIVAGASPAVIAAKTATATIPIVFFAPEDPVRLGLVTSLSRPGGNLTGVNVFVSELAAKRLELLRELVPSIPCMMMSWILQRSCLKAFVLPFGAPGDIPPCIRQRPFGIAADRQRLPLRVRAPHRRLKRPAT